ncbi:DNA-binding transcriptional MerR regulator [Humitalea rosea]|uniref:DNA-binding transcriptional MerR regulator n=1 Tax=Humitalea rosea TaxID=990373 RepID=A0A2W7IWV3_9PROT|nr:MerR family transcriptional regulator [Humitalea rosea]PZW50992.1 DNA-binding transcriptional MerR regulator [Humitalea rosea]
MTPAGDPPIGGDEAEEPQPGETGTEEGAEDELREAEGPDARARPKKAATAFRTISEVAEDLHIPQHVLRFWETKFPQLKPLKRGGGRRYYRPEDIALLKRVGDLLYTQGYTIKGVQRLLRDGDLPESVVVTETLELPLPAPQTAAGRRAAALRLAIAEIEAVIEALRVASR